MSANSRLLPVRVVITGSECTGKTVLTRNLAARFGVPWAEEFSRDYAASKGEPLTSADVEPIARGQMEREEVAAKGATSLLVLDTDLISTVLYARHYYGSCPGWIEEAALRRRADLYLLCHPDVLWRPDGIRDRGDQREELHTLFEEVLLEFGAVSIPLKGGWDEREEAAILAVKRVAGGLTSLVRI